MNLKPIYQIQTDYHPENHLHHPALTVDDKTNQYRVLDLARLIVTEQVLFQFVPFLSWVADKEQEDVTVGKNQPVIFGEWALVVWDYLDHLKLQLVKKAISAKCDLDVKQLDTLTKKEAEPLLEKINGCDQEILIFLHWNMLPTYPKLPKIMENEKPYVTIIEKYKKGAGKSRSTLPTVKELQKIALKLRSNFVEIQNRYFFVDIFYLQKIGQCCLPNVQINVLQNAGNIEVMISALSPIEPGETLCYNILQKPCDRLRSRRFQFIERFGFVCTCYFCQYQEERQKKDEEMEEKKCSEGIKFFRENPTTLLSDWVKVHLTEDVKRNGWCFHCGHLFMNRRKNKKITAKLTFCNCHQVVYCSVDCQKAHWKLLHFYSCSDPKKPMYNETDEID